MPIRIRRRGKTHQGPQGTVPETVNVFSIATALASYNARKVKLRIVCGLIESARVGHCANDGHKGGR